MNSTLLTYSNKKSNHAFAKWLVMLLMFFSFFNTNAQVSIYSYAEFNGVSNGEVYTPITGTDLFGPLFANQVNNTVPIGFTFNFNGVDYTTTKVSSNGFIAFGGSIGLAVANYTPISLAATNQYAGAISGYGRRSIYATSGSTPIYTGIDSSVEYQTTGAPGSRVFTVQFKNLARYNSTTAPLDGLLNFQIKLYEGTNVVEVIHDVQAPTTANVVATTGQCGLRGATVADFNNRSGSGVNYVSTTAGTTVTNGALSYRNTSNLGTVLRMQWTPPCYAPSGITATNLTGTTVDLGWTAPTVIPVGYQYEVRSSGAPGSGALGLGASGTSATTTTTATGLSEGFTYTVYVRSNCGGSNNSTWVTGPTFTLPCTATNVPYLLNFDPLGDGFTVPNLPVCTINNNLGTGNNWVTTNPAFDGGFFDEHLIYNFNSNAANTWFITKGINLVAGSTYRLSYIYGGSSEFTFITNRMQVRYGTTGTGAGLAAGILLDNHPEIKSSPEENVVIFTAPTSDVYYFGFNAYSAANNGRLFLDDIQIEESTCRVPTGLQAPLILVSFNNATITWTAPTPAPANGYAYYISTSNVPPSNTTPPSGVVPAGTTLTVIPSLSPSTTYYVWVRSICAPGEFGEWSASTTFTTLVAPPVYCTPVQSGTPDPNGITNVTMGSINNTTGLEPGGYGDYSGLTTNVAQGATVPVAITYATGFTYDTNIWVDWNNDGDFADVGELVYTGVSTNAVPTTLNATFVVPIAQPLGPRRLRIGGVDFGPFSDPCRNGTWQAFEDYTINVIVAPPALTISPTTMPAQCGLTNSPVVNITSNIADFDVYSWTPATGVTGDPTTGYVFNTSATTTYILTASQTSGAFSTNTTTFTYVANETPTPITISTPDGTDSCINGPAIQLNAAGGIVSNLTVFAEDFNSGINGPGQFTSINSSTGGADPSAPAWTVRPNGYNSGPPTWFATFNSNDNTSFVFTNSDSQGGSPAPSITRTRLTSPVIDLTGYTSATVSFYHHFRSWVNDDFIRVQVTTNGGATWTDLINFTTTQGTPTNFVQAFLNLNPYVGNNIQIRFDYQSRWGWGWAIDNFRVLGSASSSIVWTPATGLYTNAAATIPYVAGSGTNVVYAMPTSNTVYQATATAPGPTFCESTQTVSINVTPQVGGTLSGNQVSCEASSFTPIILTGHVGNILRWEYADDAAFTSGVTTIANTSTTLTPAEFGTFQTIRYFRAVIGAGSCNPVYSTVSFVSNNATILTGTNTWSNGLPAINKKVIIAGNYTATADFAACSIRVLTGATLTINSGVTVTVQNEFVVDGPSLPNTVVFQNGSSLLQNTNAANSGSIRYIRNSTPIIQFDYTYWSSPVANQVLNTFSPTTLSNRFYIFNHTPTVYQWANVNSASVMDAARGYIIRAPWTMSTTIPSVWSGEFYGTPHNGTYTEDVVLSGNGDRNLLGNPYPSAIFADDLYNENSSVLNGNFYFWTHNTPITANNYNANDYATYNGVGGVGTAAPTTGVNTTVPSGNIAAGQGFFVGAAATGTVNFNNTIRVYGNNNQFYRSGGIKVQTESVEKHRLWINLINNQGAYKQTLIGYIQGATNERDLRFDADVTEAGNSVSIYSLLNQDKLTIQGRALPFQVTDVIPMGVRTTLAGEYTIQLENFDGLFAQGQNVYLEDKLLGIVHDLKQGDYTFSTTGGTINDRFEIQFEEGALSVNNPKDLSNAIIVYKNNEIIFVNAGNEIMTEVKLFDARGRLITTKSNIQTSEVQFDGLQVANQLLLIQITTEKGEKVTKKIAY